jgi:hypothetical protein
VSLMQILLCITALAFGYAIMQSTALLIMTFVMALILALLVGLTAMIVLLLTVIEVLLYASEYLTRGQYAWQGKRL